MHTWRVIWSVVAFCVVATAGILSFPAWRSWLMPNSSATALETEHDHHDKDRLHLSPQARSNLQLVVKPVELRSYWRTITVPGMVVERPGRSDVGVVAPITSVVQRIAAVPGDIVRPGDELFTLRLISEPLQNSQTELLKTTRELEINRQQRDRLVKPVKEGVIPEIRLIELEQQELRLIAMRDAYRQDLAARGLTAEQIRGVEEGRFVREITVRVPARLQAGQRSGVQLVPVPGGREEEPATADDGGGFQVENLKVHLGEQVSAGQTLAVLADHHTLLIEGRAFRREVPLLLNAAKLQWPVTAAFAEEAEAAWPAYTEPLYIGYLAPTVDPESQTFPFYVLLVNQHHEYRSGGRTYRTWRFRPGQRVRLDVPVELFQEVFVLPREAVVRDGLEAFVFRANGDLLERKPVHVVFEDRRHAVLANDGSVTAGSYLAHNGAAPLLRALKAQTLETESGHDHHGHSH